MDSFTTNYLYEIINKCAQNELHQISLQQVKTAYASIGLKPGSKRKEELINDIIGYLASILIKQCNGNQIKEGFPLFNHNNELFQRNPHVKNLIEACNHQIHITNIQLAQINYTRLSQAKRVVTPTTNVYRCYCDQTIDPNFITEHVIKCINPKCGKLLHRFCMKLKTEKETYPLFECPDCVLLKSDPLHQVARILVQPFVVDNRRRDFIIDDAIFREIKVNPSLAVEVRCIKLEDKSHEQCWPHNGELVLNQYKYLEFKPLQQNSSLKKRKDEKFVTTEVNCGNNALWLKFVRGSDPRNPRAEETYIAAVYLVKRLNCDELVKKIKAENKRSIEECKKKIIDDFETSSVDIDRVVYPLTCVFDMQPLKTPAKGAYCKHPNCFSLENFVNVWQKNNQRKWNCPICKLKSYDIIVDTYFEKLIEECKKSGFDNLSQVEVQIMRNAEYKFSKIEDDSDSEDEQQKVEAKPEKQQDKALNLIVLDDSEDESNEKPKQINQTVVNKSTESSKMIIETPIPEKKKINDGAMQEEKLHSQEDQTEKSKEIKGTPSNIDQAHKNPKPSPIQISSNDATPVKMREVGEMDHKVQKFVPFPNDKEQAKALEQKHKEALQNKGLPQKNLPDQLFKQVALGAYPKDQRFKFPFGTPLDYQQQLQNSQRQFVQEKIAQQAQPQTQIPQQKQEPQKQLDFASMFAGAQLPKQALNKILEPFNATPNMMAPLFPYLGMNPKAQKMPTAPPNMNTFLQEAMLNSKQLGPNELALLMRQLELQYPNALRNGFSPSLQYPVGDMGLNFLGGMNRPQTTHEATHSILGTPGSQNSFLKESIPVKHSGLRAEGDNNGSQAKPIGAQKGIPADKNKVQKDFYESTERNIDKLIDCAEFRLVLPNFESFKANKNFEVKTINENDFKNNKELTASVMYQMPLQTNWLKDKTVNSEMAVETPASNSNTHMEIEAKALGVTKVQGKASDPICLD